MDDDGRATVIGVYPLLSDDTCMFLALDFDQNTWEQDSLAFYHICRTHSVPATRERSRSGLGCHVWMFFAEPLPAGLARRLGTMLLRLTLEHRPEIGLESFDRMFPNQDKMPKGGFCNLIALPLQRKARDVGNTLFIDDCGQAYPDQWSHLAGLSRLTKEQVEGLLQNESELSSIETTPALRKEGVIYPKHVVLELDQGVTIREELPGIVFHKLVALASFQNPEFYRRDYLRLPTYNTPRFINCVETGDNFISQAIFFNNEGYWSGMENVLDFLLKGR